MDDTNWNKIVVFAVLNGICFNFVLYIYIVDHSPTTMFNTHATKLTAANLVPGYVLVDKGAKPNISMKGRNCTQKTFSDELLLRDDELYIIY